MGVKKVKTKKYPSGWGYKTDFRIGSDRLRKIFPTRKLAEDAETSMKADALRREYNLPIDSKITIKDLVERHIENVTKYRPRITPIKTILARFLSIAGPERNVESIKTADLNDYAESRLDAGLAPQSINREVVEIKSCLSAATKYYKSLQDWQPPKAIWQDEDSDGRNRLWTDAEFEAVMKELIAPKREGEQQWQANQRHTVGEMFLVASQTAMRGGEVASIKKTDLNFDTCEISVTSQKGKGSRGKATTRKVPMMDDVVEIMQRRVETVFGDYIFPNFTGGGAFKTYQKAFKAAALRAKVLYGLNVPGGVIFNDIRKTAENKMLDAGFNPKDVGDILGHSVETQLRYYAKSSDEKRRAALQVTKISVLKVSKDTTVAIPTIPIIEE